MNNNNVSYLGSFRLEHISKEYINKAFIKNKNIKTNIFRVQAYDSVRCGYFCIGFTDLLKTLTEYTNVFLPKNFKKNDDMSILWPIINTYKMESHCLQCKKKYWKHRSKNFC